MKTIIIVLSISMVLMATTGIVAAKALYDKASEPCSHEVKASNVDTTAVWRDGKRLVSYFDNASLFSWIIDPSTGDTVSFSGCHATMYDRKQHSHVYIPYRDTVLIDPSRPITSAWDEYEIKFDKDSIYIYDAQELIAALNARECGKIHPILMSKND